MHPEHADDKADRMDSRRSAKWKRTFRILTFISQGLSIIFSLIILAMMIYTFARFVATRTDIKAGRRAWPKDSKVWPTIMLLVGAVITLVISIVTLLAYCWCFNRVERSWTFLISRLAVQVAVWFVITFLYRYEKSRNNVNDDLWGWSCVNQSTATQRAFMGSLNFGGLCDIQVRRRSIFGY